MEEKKIVFQRLYGIASGMLYDPLLNYCFVKYDILGLIQIWVWMMLQAWNIYCREMYPHCYSFWLATLLASWAKVNNGSAD